MYVPLFFFLFPRWTTTRATSSRIFLYLLYTLRTCVEKINELLPRANSLSFIAISFFSTCEHKRKIQCVIRARATSIYFAACLAEKKLFLLQTWKKLQILRKIFSKNRIKKKVFYSNFSKLINFLTNLLWVERGKRTLPRWQKLSVYYSYMPKQIFTNVHMRVSLSSLYYVHVRALTHEFQFPSYYIYFHQLHFIIMHMVMVDCIYCICIWRDKQRAA